MASGKTTVGKIIAEMLDFKFADTDEYIENDTKMSVNDIFKKYGEKHFRELEEKAVIVCSDSENTVISCGGGVVLRETNIINLRKNGIIFNLNPTEEVIVSRLTKAADTRPLLDKNNAVDALEKFRSRKSFYDNCDYRINIDINKTSKEIAEEIIRIYREEG